MKQAKHSAACVSVSSSQAVICMTAGVCVCVWLIAALRTDLVTFAGQPTTSEWSSQCSRTFGNPSQSCWPETCLCFVILSSKVTKVEAAGHRLRVDFHSRKISGSFYTTRCIEGWIKTQGSCFAAARANSCEVLGQAGGCLSVSLSLPARPELHHWQDTEWIPARSH